MGIPEHELLVRVTKEDAEHYFALRDIEWREEKARNRKSKPWPGKR